MEISKTVMRFYDDCVRHRRELHKIPEIAYHEYETHRYLMQELEALKPDRLEPLATTGIKAVFYAPCAKETIAFRADIDALPIKEKTGLPFASENDGFMHACGHDGHAAALLTFAMLLAQKRESLKVNIVLIFQPAEEGAAGANRIIEEGALENPKIDRMYGFHLWPQIPLGEVGFREGPLMAQSCGMDITIKGKSVPGFRPGQNVDAITTAAELITVLQTLVSRIVSPEESVVFTIGRIEGGSARNVIAKKVVLNCTLRTFSDDLFHNVIFPHIEDMVKGFALASGAEITIDVPQLYHCLSNPKELSEHFKKLLGEDVNDAIPRAMNSEDYSFYQKKIPALYFFVGIEDCEDFPPLHNSLFYYNESALLSAMEVYYRIVCDACGVDSL